MTTDTPAGPTVTDPVAPAPLLAGRAAWLRGAGDAAWRLLGIAAVIYLVFYVVGLVQIAFVAVYLALVLTAVLLPLGNLFDRVMPRGIAILATILTALAVVGGLITYVVWSIVGRWEELVEQVGAGLDQLVPLAQGLPLPIRPSGDLESQGAAWVQQNSEAIVDGALASAGSVLTGTTTVVLAVFCTVFFLSGGGRMWRWVLEQLPDRVRGPWRDAGGAAWTTFSGYTRGITFVALTDGLLAGVFLTLMGVPLALPLSVVVFLAAYVPMVGPVAAIIIAAVVSLATNGPTTGLFVALGMVVIAQVDANVLQPLITGRQVSLHPVVMALAITCGTLVGGLLGAVVAVPLTAVSWAVLSTLRARKPVVSDRAGG